MPRNDHRRAVLVALGRVVEHHVENHFDARLMHGAHHLLELAGSARRRRDWYEYAAFGAQNAVG